MISELVFFVKKIAFGLYILSVGGIFYMLYRLHHARRDLSASQFKLEREHALVRQASAITFAGLLIEFVLGVWAVANLMAPTIRDIRLSSGTGANAGQERWETSTPVSNPPVVLDTGGPSSEGPAPFATPVPTATAVGTIVPDAPDVVGCPRDSAWLLIPGNGQLLFEATTVWGTASVSDFAFYRFEIKPMTAGAEFAPIGGDYTVPVVDGPLGDILPFNFPTGEYRFRVAVFDNTTMMRAVCEVTIFISEPPATATPIGVSAASPTPAP